MACAAQLLTTFSARQVSNLLAAAPILRAIARDSNESLRQSRMKVAAACARRFTATLDTSDADRRTS
jgi:hypothetical protein